MVDYGNYLDQLAHLLLSPSKKKDPTLAGLVLGAEIRDGSIQQFDAFLQQAIKFDAAIEDCVWPHPAPPVPGRSRGAVGSR